MDFFERQHQARLHTRKLVFFFILAVLMIIGVLNVIGFYLVNLSPDYQFSLRDWPLSPFSLGITAGSILVIILGSALRYWQVKGGGTAVAEMVGARQVSMDSKLPEERRLINVVEEMSIASGMPVPDIYIMDHETGLNAFVAGLEPSDTVLVITRGLLDSLDRQELQGVVAHEFSHIFHSDMTINMRLIGILGGILAIGQLGYYVLRSLRYSGGSGRTRIRTRSSGGSSGGGGGQIIVFLIAMSLALVVVGYIGLFFGRLIKAAISRQREYLADASAVQYSRDSMGIANALYKIKTNGHGSLLDSSHAEDMSHMCFGNALNLTAFSGMLATHPPIDDRISALVPGYRSIRRQMDEQPVDNLSPITHFAQQSGNQDQSYQAPTNSAALTASIGTLKPEQLEEATRIHDSLPESLLEAARSPEQVSALLLCLISHSNQTDWSTQQQLLAEKLEPPEITQIEKLQRHQVSADQRLPLVEIAIPAIRRQAPEQAKALLINSSHLILADKQISPFEFFLYALLRKHLKQTDEAKKIKRLNSYQKVSKEVSYLLSVMALVGNNYDPHKVEQLVSSFIPGWTAPAEAVVFDAKQLHHALTQLNRLSPLLKKPLMLTLSELVMDDGILRPTELELMRATGLYLECPIPPVVEQLTN